MRASREWSRVSGLAKSSLVTRGSASLAELFTLYFELLRPCLFTGFGPAEWDRQINTLLKL